MTQYNLQGLQDPTGMRRTDLSSTASDDATAAALLRGVAIPTVNNFLEGNDVDISVSGPDVTIGVNISEVASDLEADGFPKVDDITVLSPITRAFTAPNKIELDFDETAALTLSNASNVFTGNGAALTNLNGSAIATGTVADARLSAAAQDAITKRHSQNTDTGTDQLEFTIGSTTDPDSPGGTTSLKFGGVGTPKIFYWSASDAYFKLTDPIHFLAAATVDAGGLTVTSGGVNVVSGGLTVSADGATIGGDSSVTGTLTATTFSGSGASLTNLNASNLASGTVPDARFPATLPAVSGANLTNLDASDLASGTIPDARFPATLPALSGVNLTNLDASDLASGTVPSARVSGTYSNALTLSSASNDLHGKVTIDASGHSGVASFGDTDQSVHVTNANVLTTDVIPVTYLDNGSGDAAGGGALYVFIDSGGGGFTIASTNPISMGIDVNWRIIH